MDCKDGEWKMEDGMGVKTVDHSNERTPIDFGFEKRREEDGEEL